jgi:hypothetical protein
MGVTENRNRKMYKFSKSGSYTELTWLPEIRRQERVEKMGMGMGHGAAETFN